MQHVSRIRKEVTMKTKFLAFALLTAASVFGADLSIGIRIGNPPPPRVVRVRPVSPGPGFFWVEGYWYPNGRSYRWHDGYWTRPPYAGAVWIAPRHENGLFYNGYWEGPRGRTDHDHRWDRDRNHRDYRDYDNRR